MSAVAVILMSLLFLVVQCRAAEFTPTTASGETLRNIFRDGEQAVVGSSAALYRIDLNSLSVQETLALPSENRMLVPDLEETNFVSCDSNRCFLAAISDFNQVSWEVPSDTIIRRETDDTVASILAPSMTGVPELTFGEVANGNDARRFVKGALSSTTPEFISIADYQEANRFESFNYHLEFAHNGFIYFVTDKDDESIYPRVTRFCQNDTGAEGRFGSQYEIRLACGSEEASNDRRITTATFVTGPPFNEPTILIATLTSAEAFSVDICSYSVAEIDRRMWDHFVDCIDGVEDVMSGFRRDGQSQCVAVPASQREMALRSICRLPGLRLGLEVPEIYRNDSLVTQTLDTNEHFTSLTTTTVQGSLLLFAGSSKSRLHQFHIDSSTSAVFIRSIPLNEAPMTNVTHLFPSADGEYVYAMTPNKLFRHTVDQCQSLTDCTLCLTSNDPICGWCALSRVCIRDSECDRVEGERVFVLEEGQCPAITSSTPAILYLELVEQHRASITLTTSNIRNSNASELEFDCVFTFLPEEVGSEVVRQQASKPGNADDFVCLSPMGDEIPELPDSIDPVVDTINVSVSLQPRATQRNFATSDTPIAITDCSVHTGCMSCISSGVGKCRWCPLSFTCVSDFGDLSVCPNTLETTISDSCQAILPHINTTNYLLHSGVDYPSRPLQINSEQLDIFSDEDFTCRVCETDSCDNLITEVQATFIQDSNIVECHLNSIQFPSLSLSMPSVDLTLQVLVNRFIIDNPADVKVTVYSCEHMGSNCAQCLSLDDQYGCEYCGAAFGRPGTCNFLQLDRDQCERDSLVEFEAIGDCDPPSIADFTPRSGPSPGGTEVSITGHNLGVESTDIGRISIGGVTCTMTSYRPGVGMNCTTTSMTSNLIFGPIEIELNFQDETISSQDNFEFLAPSLNNPPATPGFGPVSGGTRINITGQHLGIGSSRSVILRQEPCEVVGFDSDSIVCITPGSDQSIINNLLEVRIDNWRAQISGFDYLDDPTFEGISPNVSFFQGGTTFTVTGQNLDVVQEPRLLLYVAGVVSQQQKRQADMPEEIEYRLEHGEPCVVTSSTSMQCLAPPLDGVGGDIPLPVSARVGLVMDGVTDLLDLDTTVFVHQDPLFDEFSLIVFGQNDRMELSISGERFLFTPEQVLILITPCAAEDNVCLCVVLQVHANNNTLVCEIADPEDLPTNEDLQLEVRVGDFSALPGSIRISTTPELLIILVPAFAGFIIICVVIFIVLFAVFCSKARQKDQRYDQLMMELERLESSVARECKLGFAELQTDLDELTGDVAGCRLPYHDLQAFLLATLFPDCKNHPILHPVQVPNHHRPPTMRALRDFGDLLNDRKVLLLFIQTLEEQRSFGIRDKSIVGSLMIVALHNRMDYVTDVLKRLLTQLIRKTVANSIPKLLLRRTESIAEKMLTNWLAFCLQGYVQEHAGQPMYLLYRAVKNQLEKGPVDVITGEARYSLSEQKLIRQKVDVVPISATVETDDGHRVPVKLLDCDTISQAKEKLLDSMYKAAPVSKRPKLTDVDLEYLKSPSESTILRDEDHSTVVEGGWKRVNTLRHYWVQDGAMFRMKSRRDFAPPGRVYDYPGSIIATHAPRQRALSEAEDGSRVWHLFKQVEVEDPRRSPFLNKKLVSEIYLPRMLSTKSILQNFVDDLFNSLFSITHPPSSPSTMYVAAFPQSPGINVPMGYAPGADAVPMAVKYLFDFLDDEAENCKIMDTDVVHTWKNNALALRFWVNMIKNPEFVFDINKSHTADACLSVIAQAFIDGCSSAETKLTIDSPTSKLLYNKEVQGYKAKVKKFYSDVKQMPRIPENAMQHYLTQLSEYQTQQMKKTGGFVTESAINELLRYALRYSEPFLSNLRNAGLQQRAYQFEGVLKVTRSSTQL